MKYFKNMDMNRGAALLLLSFMLLFLIFIGRFFYIQSTGKAAGVDAKKLTEELQTAEQVVPTKRGTIYDNNGIVIAEDVSGFQVLAKLTEKNSPPKKRDYIKEEEKEEAAKKLASILNEDEDYILKRLRANQDQVEFGPKGKNLTFTQKQQIEKLNIPGIFIITNRNRYYPNGMFASHVIGYADEDGGKMGIEQAYDDLLKNQDGLVTFKKDRHGTILPKTTPVYKEESINGKEIYLTLDARIQSFVDDALTEVNEKYEPERLVAIVADPKTGKILGMSSRPSFDPNERNIQDYTNHALSPYEPGSTMKVFTLAAAVNEGVFKGDEYYQSGSYKVAGATIHDHNVSGWGSISFLEGVQRSSNVAFSILAEHKLGFDKLYEYLHAFKFNEKTGIDLPGETTGTIRFKYPVEKITTAFGQGTSITPIQQIQAFTAIGNEGKMMKPYVIDRVVDPDTGKVISETQPTVAGTPITKETAKEVLDILETVITAKAGTGKDFALENYSVAGKTGQAQIASEKGYLYGHGNYIYSFIGMVPKEDPELAIYVAVDRPKLKDTELGTKPVSTIFKSVATNSLEYLKIKPTKKTTEEDESAVESKDSIEVPNFKGQSIEAAKEEAKKQGLQLVALGEGKIVDQFPKKGETVVGKSRIIVKTSENVQLPNLTDWTRQEVSMLSELLKVEIHYIGSGYVYNQSIAANTIIKDDKETKLVVKLKKPGQKGEVAPEAKPKDGKPRD
ncbi:MAG: penicillin-binding transpeptidase domain-containing protein [Bacillaceae bacterium]